MNCDDKRTQVRKQARELIIAENNDARGNDATSLRGLSNNELLKRQKLSVHEKMVNVYNNQILFGRRNTYLVTLAQHISAGQENVRSTYEMARYACRTPDKNDAM